MLNRAWYGVICTGGQAGFALESLADIGRETHPLAFPCLTRDRYVDDLTPGASTKEIREDQISQVLALLGRIRFMLKYIVRSGEKPGGDASSDGESIKLLGYKWFTEEDMLAPGIAELNLNKEVRGARKPNITPIVSYKDAKELLNPLSLTRRHVISKVSEFFILLVYGNPLNYNLNYMPPS